MRNIFSSYLHLFGFAALITAIVFISDHRESGLLTQRSSSLPLSESLESLHKKASQLAFENGRDFALKSHRTNEGVLLTLHIGRHFYPGSSGMIKPADKKLISLLKKLDLHQLQASIEVEGHTDTSTVKSAQSWKHPTNWSLSVARANKIANMLLQLGLPATQLKVSGRGPALAAERESRNIASEQDKTLNSINDRKILIYVRSKNF